MAWDTTDYGWFNKGSGGSSAPSGPTQFPDYSGVFGPNSPIQSDTWKIGFGAQDNQSKGKDFLDAFKNLKLDSNQNKYQQQAQQGGFQTGGGEKSSSPYVGEIAKDLHIVYPPTPYSPITVQGVQGKQGAGGLIGQFAGAALGFALGGPAGAGLGSSLGGSLGGAIG